MQNNKNNSHSIALRNRTEGNISGVVDVCSFDVNEIILETTEGMLRIKGKELHISKINLEQGEVDLEGMVKTISYEKMPVLGRGKNNLMARMTAREQVVMHDR